jgi:hypothetical protein
MALLDSDRSVISVTGDVLFNSTCHVIKDNSIHCPILYPLALIYKKAIVQLRPCVSGAGEKSPKPTSLAHHGDQTKNHTLLVRYVSIQLLAESVIIMGHRVLGLY